MSESYELTAEARERVGKGSAREIRRNGKIPAVIYGEKQPPLPITLPYKEVHLRITSGGFMTTIATINVDGKKIQVLPKDYQLDPVRDFTMHVDFLRVGKGTIVTVNIPVHFENEDESPGIRRGGVLNIVRHDIEFTCPANAIPDAITVDLTGLELGDSVHISAVKLPEGVKPTITDRDFTIATIAAPAGLKSEEDAEAPEAPETEIVGEESTDGEGENEAE
ncbi:50S ribosomal protein L25/general stress protein Ctc [Nitratireductor sp. CAU 1489]|uniref:Large ribosomal subunit protein bL25 n=1 Tax=Nitratireductor arenosus TaxID=2682096 RepID=A0A844QNG8_9HYPH|nr:50S ribosomal protein L25/general stress protein Ctc [Nitratireductor arenosus]MVA99490.1 50S ribosomal protein L25/general stress protein Ctc [Nitratireductor arenosus]